MTNDFSAKKCFIITPIGGTESEIRRATEGLIEAVIIPTLNDLGFKTENISVAHRISESGSINRQIIKKIIEDDLAIVNLTGLNPNVMYELAVRHAIAKPVIMLAEDGTGLPFDIVDQRTIFYKNDMLGAVQLKEDLKTFVLAVLKNTNVENPLIQLIQENNALNNISGIDKDAAEIILDRLDRIERTTFNSNKESKNQKVLRIEFKYNGKESEERVSDYITKCLFSGTFGDNVHGYSLLFKNKQSQTPMVILEVDLLRPIKERFRYILFREFIDDDIIVGIESITY
ncbi:hypothetical protein [Lysinibacillus sp. NPDC086135]|uniref:hypothetical protein n=1 Tax=Lysinibacillus sp. NPDC086135 TaxID=3364130 RepID=UPI003821CBD0